MIYSRFNSALVYSRRLNLDGIYDTHTNVMHYPKLMQPTHAYWEQLSTTSGTQIVPQSSPGQEGDKENDGDSDVIPPPDTIFSSVPPALARNFFITDTYYLSPPQSGLGIPGPDEAVLDIDPEGLTHVHEEVIAELPEECRRAFDAARSQEAKWKATWDQGRIGQAKAELRISYNGMSTMQR